MSKETTQLLSKAEHLVEINRAKEAIPLAAQALAQDPDNYRANCVLSLCYLKIEDFNASIEYAEKAIRSNPDAEAAHRIRSYSLLNLGRKKEALNSAREAKRIAPDSLLALSAFVEMCLNSNLREEAEIAARQMIQISPESELAHFSLGNVLLHKGDNWDAKESFKRALKINPSSALARNNLGVAQLRGVNPNQQPMLDARRLSIAPPENNAAEDHFTEAIKLDPANELVARNLRAQYDLLIPLYFVAFLVPFLAITFFVIPGWALVFLFFGTIGVTRVVWQRWRARRALPYEVRLFLRSSAPKGTLNRTVEIKRLGKKFFEKTWPPHLLAMAAVILAYLPGHSPSFTATSSWNGAIAFLLTLFSGFWLGVRIRSSG